MKKNVMMRVASALLVAVLMTTCAISGTFAKYTSTASGTGTAKVAKWAFELNGTEMANAFTFDLAETWTEYNGSTENEVTADLLAPGTAGSFAIVLENTSEVAASYELTFTEAFTNYPTSVAEADFPVEYSLDGANWDKDITNLVATGVLNMGDDTTVTVYWHWVFYVDAAQDVIDTALGINEVEVTITANAILTQVD